MGEITVEEEENTPDNVLADTEVYNKFKDSELEGIQEECPSILSADPFTERKSTFQGHAATVTNAGQVK